ncbi:MAPEG family protein [Marinobacteraceae bacterium S3BR75-40.1]
MVVPITAIYASVLGLMALFLAYRVTVFRRGTKTGLGDRGDRDFQTAIRAHANFVEYTPIFLIILFVGELNGVPVWGVHLAGLMFVLSRFAHAWGMYESRGGAHPGRFWGIVGTWLGTLIAIVMTIQNALVLGV